MFEYMYLVNRLIIIVNLARKAVIAVSYTHLDVYKRQPLRYINKYISFKIKIIIIHTSKRSETQPIIE